MTDEILKQIKQIKLLLIAFLSIFLIVGITWWVFYGHETTVDIQNIHQDIKEMWDLINPVKEKPLIFPLG